MSVNAKYKKNNSKMYSNVQNSFSNTLYSCTLICTLYIFYLISLLSFLPFSTIYIFSSATSSLLSILDIKIYQDIFLEKINII